MNGPQVEARQYASVVAVKVTGEDKRQVQHAERALANAIYVAMISLERRYPMLDFTTDF